MTNHRAILSGVLAGAMLWSVGCGSLGFRQPVPAALVGQAQVPGLPDVRLVLEPEQLDLTPARRFFGNAVERTANATRPPILLALSGGGSDGAFGAGLLCGWTEAGDRPEFDVVTGISTGALIGPYAFLGPAYDEELKESYTNISETDIFRRRGLLGILKHRDAMASSAPLARQLSCRFDRGKLEAIAAEHRKGRRFYVGTTHLDAQCITIWDMGAIAASGHPDAHRLFCSILLASASVPVAFPPVYFKVEAGGRRYDEMHADGGVMTQVFGPAILSRLLAATGCREGRVYVVRNSRLTAEWKATKPNLVSIAGRSVNTMIKTQGFGDLYRSYLATRGGEVDFNLAAIPLDFGLTREGEFDPLYMRALFATGYNQARRGFPWAKAPPGFE